MKSSTLKSQGKKLRTKELSSPVAEQFKPAPKEKPVKLDLSTLTHSFINAQGKTVFLKDFLKEGDWWALKSRKGVSWIVLHDAVKRIAVEAGISTDPEYKLFITPTTQNNYTTAIQVTITDSMGRRTTDIGETSRDNLGTRGRNNPINMAQKRAFDRAVFNHLGITGLLGEDELQEDEEKNTMDDFESLPDNEKQEIAPLLNEIFAVKDKKDLMSFKVKMSKTKVGLNDAQLSVLRLRWKKKLAELTETKF